MALDAEDLRYLTEVVQTLEQALQREQDPAETARLAELLREVRLRINEGRIE